MKVCHKKTLNLGQMSFVVIHCDTNRYLVHEFIWAANSNFRSLLPHFRDIIELQSEHLYIFHTPLRFRLKFEMLAC